VKKYRLYSSQSGWTNRNASLETHLGIPNGKGTFCYGVLAQVENPDNDEYGKYIMPVMMDGDWKCDDQFAPADLVDFDPTWRIDPIPPELPEE